MQDQDIEGVILAGGQATRMGGLDKGLVQLKSIALFEHVYRRLDKQVCRISINANRNLSCYQRSGLVVFPDVIGNYAGPLAGMLSGLIQAQTEWVFFAPCDTPFIPTDIVAKLWQEKGNCLAIYVNDGERAHPAIALLHRSLISAITTTLQQDKQKLLLFFNEINAASLWYPHPEHFININTLETCLKLEQAQNLL